MVVPARVRILKQNTRATTQYRKEEATWTFLDVSCITSLEILAWHGQLERLIRIISTTVNFFDSVSLELISNGWDGCVRSL